MPIVPLRMKILNFIKKARIDCWGVFCRMLPVHNNKIIFWANSFKQYGCSPKYITEYILRNYPNRFQIVWVFERGVELPDSLPPEVKVVRYFSLDYLKELHTAHYVICNMRTGDAYLWKKRRNQKYIQTWHSSLRLKKIEKDAQESLPMSYVKSAINDSLKIDLLISGCDFSTNIFSKSFWYCGKILKSGTPRCDLFFHDSSLIKHKVCDSMGIDLSDKILLYAPTFRSDKTASLHDFEFKRLKIILEQKFGGKWVIAYRFHPNIIESYSFCEDAIDVTAYSDMQELISASDILVTDYSSCMFDMAIAGKPCFLYTPDIDNYMKNERGLYFTPHDLPFPFARTNEEFIESIMSFDDARYGLQVKKFMEKVGSYEKGNASERVVDYILENMQ